MLCRLGCDFTARRRDGRQQCSRCWCGIIEENTFRGNLGGVPAKRIMTVDEFAEKCKQGDGNIYIGSGNKREILEKYFSEEKYNGTEN